MVLTALGAGVLLPLCAAKPADTLTLEDKVNFVVGTQRDYIYRPDAAPGMPLRVQGDTDDPRGATAFSEGPVKGAAGETYDLTSKGLPPIVMADGPAGVRIDAVREGDSATYYCTAFPCATLLASSWNIPLVEEVGDAIGNEARHYGVDILLAPAMNIMRSPLCGRNFEYYSEDPFLTGKTAAAYVRGVQRNGVGATLKHFAANNQETMRNGIDVVVSDRALRDIYLEGFRIAVAESNPAAVMSAYNKVNGKLMAENRYLLTDILRGEWGFDGFVMTDWWGEGNGARQLAAGNDMLMPGTWRQYDEIMEAIAEGRFTEQQLDSNVAAIKRVASLYRGACDNAPDLKAHAAVARRAATDGMVLLENRDRALPIAKGSKIALFGNAGYDTFVGGTGSGNVNRAYKVDIAEGLVNAGYNLDRLTADGYAARLARFKEGREADDMWNVAVAPEYLLTENEISRAAADNDIAVLVVSRMAGESADRTLTPGDWFLSDTERANISNVSRIFHEARKPVAVLLNMGSVVEMESWKDMPDAILHVWLPGQEAGNAVADVLSGDVTPSGRLPMTIARRYEDYGSAANFPNSENAATVYYTDDIFVGYRHFDNSGIEPLYPFGYGLSYTTFEYTAPVVTMREDGALDIELDVTNTGSVPGADVVKVYRQYPRGAEPSFDIIEGSEIYVNPEVDPTNPVMPVRELKAYAKTDVLAPGQTRRIKLTLK